KTDKKGKKLTVKKLELPVSGRYFLLITTQAPTDFTLKTKAKLLKKLVEKIPIASASVHDEFYAALPGSQLSVKLSRLKLSVLQPRIVGVLDPTGAEIDLSPFKLKTNERMESVSGIQLERFGDHTIRLGAKEGSLGDVATMKVKAKHPKPRKSKLDGANIRVDPVIDAISVPVAFDNNKIPDGADLPDVSVTGSFFRKGVALTLESPGGPTLTPTSLSRPNHTLIIASFDLGDEPVGDYEVVVTNPDGTAARLSRDPLDEAMPAFRLLRAPRATGLAPTVVFDSPYYSSTPMTITGDSFQTGVTITLTPMDSGDFDPARVDGQVAFVITDTTLSFAVICSNRDLGEYRLTVTNPDGGTTDVPGLMELREGPRVTSIDVSGGFDNESVTGINLLGAHLLKTPTIELLQGGTVIEASETWISSTAVSFDVDLNGMPEGGYDLRLTNPDGGIDVLSNAFVVMPAPIPTGVDPDRVFAGETIDPFDIFGDRFEDGTTIRLTQGTSFMAPTAQFVDETELTTTLDLAGDLSGFWDLEVTNPDGGRATLSDALNVLGPFALVAEDLPASRPAVGYDPVRDEYLVVFTRTPSVGNTDIRGYRVSAETGEVLGSEIIVTNTTAVSEDQPHLAFDPDGERFLVVYRSGGTDILASEVASGGSVGAGVLTLASGSVTVGWPRVAYNGDETEFLVVYERQTSGSNWDAYAARVPVSGGLSQSAVDGFALSAGSEPEREPDVAYDPDESIYVVVFALDPAAPPEEDPPPPETLHEVVVGQLPGTSSVLDNAIFAGNSVGEDRKPRVAWNPDADELLLVWETWTSDDDHDLMARRYDPAGSGSFADDAVKVEDETSGAVDARGAALVWDGDSSRFRIAYSILGEDIVVTHASATLGDLVHQTAMSGSTGDVFEQPTIAVRGSGGEFFLAYRASVSDPADLEIQGHVLRKTD
ncbi:MAG: hypothetical protein ACYTDY_09180, partial [Planctomycetota bacterium]